MASSTTIGVPGGERGSGGPFPLCQSFLVLASFLTMINSPFPRCGAAACWRLGLSHIIAPASIGVSSEPLHTSKFTTASKYIEALIR